MRYFVEVCYDGTAFHGSQVQGDTATVQYALNQALGVLLRRSVETFGASRTDEGVHAHSNFYHFDEHESLHPQFLYKLNAILPMSMAAKQIYTSSREDANARFDAVSRCYRYRIYSKKDPFLFQRALHFPYKINEELLHETAQTLFDYNDFETFSKRNSQTFTFLCTIKQSRWERHGAELHYIVEANRFLRGMVRGLVGTQLQIARGKNTVDGFRKIIEAKDCTFADFSVAGHGLYLEAVNYPEGFLRPLSLG